MIGRAIQYLRVLFLSECRMEWEIGAASAVMQGLHQLVVVGKEPKGKGLNILVDLHSLSYLWSQAVGSD